MVFSDVGLWSSSNQWKEFYYIMTYYPYEEIISNHVMEIYLNENDLKLFVRCYLNIYFHVYI